VLWEKNEVTPDQLEKLLTQRESATMERKESARELPHSLFETVCAFLNQNGGTILLGVADDGAVVGIDADVVERLKAEIVNLSNNPQKLNPPFIISPLSLDYQGKHILVLQVPVSSQIHRCNGIVYDRGHEGDFRVTDPVQIAAMVNRKQNYYTELTVYPYLHVSDFEPGLLDKERRGASAQGRILAQRSADGAGRLYAGGGSDVWKRRCYPATDSTLQD